MRKSFGLTVGVILGVTLGACAGAAPAAPGGSIVASNSAPKLAAANGPAASAGASAAEPSAATYKITVPYTAVSGAFAALWVAADAGFFQNYSIQADVRNLDASVAVPALVSGEVDFAASPAMVSAVLAGSDVTFIGRLATGPIFSIYAVKGISSVEDLRGKVFADTIVGSAPDTALRDILTKHGIKDTDVQLIHVPNPAAVMGAMQSGQAVAGIIPPPVTLQARKAGYVELTGTVKEGVPGLTAALSTKKTRLKDNPAEVRAFLQALKDATAYLRTNVAGTKAIIGKYSKTDPGPDLDETYDAFAPVWEMGAVQASDIAATLRYLPDARAATADPASFFDNSLLDTLK